MYCSFHLDKKPKKKNSPRNLASERTHYTKANPYPNPLLVFENPNLIPKILRRQESQGSFASSRPLYRSISYPVKWIYLEDEPFDEQFETSLFVNFSKSELSHLAQDPVFIEDLQFEFVTSHLEKNL